MAQTPQQKAATAIRRADPTFAGIIRRSGPPPRMQALPVKERFGALASAILYQQLAGSAAAAIEARVVGVLGGEITARRLLAAPDALLAGCGVSAPKRRALLDLAARSQDGRLRLDLVGRYTEERAEAMLCEVLGIGPWTAQMFAMHALGRRDVWPAGDYGVRVGWTRLHGGGDPVDHRELAGLGDPFRPHRSAVAWYCWRAAGEPRAAGPTG
jgi:DNA-3-methyladenine glycosylase II